MGCASLILLLVLNTLVPSLTGKPDSVCISQGGRFPPFSSEGKPPKRLSKGPKDLTLCRVFRKKTCCDVAQTHPALVSVRKLASSGEAGPECLHVWELLECSICDPRIGVQSGPPAICASFCDRVFEACAEAYYSTDAITQVLAPCGVNDYVCGRASEWIRNGTEFCHAAGFAVKDDVSVSNEEAFCYGGKGSLDLIADSWKASPSEVLQKGESLRLLEEFRQRWREMPFSERVSWAVGGLVLTAGLLFVSKRKRRSQRHNVAALRIRKFEAKINQKSPSSPRSRKNK
ncbi:folate-binding protein 1-like isoform X2 [Pyrus communis]|uniref:folate-binding protein 1-like isoform X2 n=1 Tax=Pyrus communis TaxID=23211 RepID=UPI0035C264BE